MVSEPLTATEIRERFEKSNRENQEKLNAAVDALAVKITGDIALTMLEHEAEKVSRLTEDIRLLQASEANLKKEVAILQNIINEAGL